MKKVAMGGEQIDCEGTRRIGAPQGPRQAEKRRMVLIEAATRLFVEKGYEATTMDEVANTANYAKGTLYHYFKNKAELLQVLQKNFEEEVMKRIRLRVESCSADDWRGCIKAWIDAAVGAYFDMYKLHDVVFYSSGMPFRYAMADAEIISYLADLIRGGHRAGAWKVDDERWTAVVMFHSFRGGCDEAIMGAQPTEDVSRKLNTVFLRILGAYD